MFKFKSWIWRKVAGKKYKCHRIFFPKFGVIRILMFLFRSKKQKDQTINLHSLDSKWFYELTRFYGILYINFDIKMLSQGCIQTVLKCLITFWEALKSSTKALKMFMKRRFLNHGLGPNCFSVLFLGRQATHSN